MKALPMQHMKKEMPQFYVTAPQPCPYLEGQVERKLFTALNGDDAHILNDALSRQGFRRSQNVLYRPSCAACTACLSARIKVNAFGPSRTQKRILRRNTMLERTTNAPWATEDQYELFRRYLDARHSEGGMADMDVFEFSAMVEETPVQSRVVEYTDQTTGNLTAVALTDVLEDGLSMVYSFFDPDMSNRSLGTYLILDHVKLAQELGLPYVYLGYWVPGSSKMAYKARFRPLEIYRNGEWQPLTDPNEIASTTADGMPDAIRDQVAAIHLPQLDQL